jgi:acyl transferase domain-containing protein/NAD(P)H-dependent flavin oxidoreductase YrpB (nitropropane dioxygenase family)/NAD(P)-dependent dehydrogenase (short-subunit alcohol dehydrogenase family)
MTLAREFELIAATPANQLDPSIAVSAIRAGYPAVFDLEYANLNADIPADALRTFKMSGNGPLGVKLRAGDAVHLDRLCPGFTARLGTVILTPGDPAALRRDVALLRAAAPQAARLLLEVVSPDEVALAEELQLDGLVVKGHESGGRVGESASFILLQQLCRRTALPVWAQGGIGLHTVAAAYVAGAAGAVLDQQLLLVRESAIPETMKKALGRADGSETLCLGDECGQAYRIYNSPGPFAAAASALAKTERELSRDGTAAGARWQAAVTAAVSPAQPEKSVWLLGQDLAFARPLAQEFKTVPGVMHAFRQAIASHLRDAQAARPLAPGSALAVAHGTQFPVVQGPMTRVSDRAEFALEVAAGGALPFLALALMRGPEVERLLNETRELLGGKKWGVGILGFVPAELRQEQLAVVHAFKPDFALIAGGRPEQAAELEQAGIPTYLHVPSPGLLQLFLEAGTRRFVFEGRECGGHVGPRSSFVLWNQMIDVLCSTLDPATASDVHVLFAGGIHDRLSSAMVAAATGPLARLGCRIGALIGTAYTFTEEAVKGGAVVATFQNEAVACTRTALLESGPGHAIRCVETPFVASFASTRRRLLDEGGDHESIRDALEDLNIGRLRIATKGIDRNPRHGEDQSAPQFVTLDTSRQQTEGLYMIGQVALLRDAVCTIAELHHDVCAAGTELLESMAAPQAVAAAAPPGKPAAAAIVGMGCILPGAPDLATYWENILDKVDAIREVPEDRWDWRRYFDPDPTAKDKIYSKWGGFIDDTPFDPLHYGIPPNSLKSIEPLHLLTLETVRAALVDAGFEDGHIADPELRKRTSVILGVGGGTGSLGQAYAVRASLQGLMEAPPAEVFERLPEWTEDSFPGVLINVTAGRVANRFDLGGVNFTVDAACGSSLAAVRLAVQELLAGTSDMVIVGGADTFQNPFDFTAFCKTHALSPRGKCSTFDAGADGIAIGEGVAIVVLRRLDEAVREGARVYACIQGVGGSSDGRDKSLTAPRPEGQALALERAYGMAKFSPATVGLIEAHGTGTVAGDRAEVSTLNAVFGAAGAETQSCAIGSVKSMIGHTKCAAGTAGLIKAALALYHQVLPPTNNVERPIPDAKFAESPFYVASESRPWIAPADGTPRRGGVSAFGFGGTNFHVVLEEFDRGGPDPDGKALRRRFPAELFLIGAASETELARQVEALAGAATAATPLELRDLAYSRWIAFNAAATWRLAIVAGSHQELAERAEAFAKYRRETGLGTAGAALMRAIDPRGVYLSTAPATAEQKVAFLFPGQGSQYPNMLRDLALQFADVGEVFARADAVLGGKLPRRLSSFVFPPAAFSDDERKAQRLAVTQTQVAQPAIGAASVAMARLLVSMGVNADIAAGHSYGEYVALHHGGAYDEATLLALSEARGRCMVETTAADPGTMASVMADAETVQRHLGDGSLAQIANRNAPDLTVIAGPKEAVAQASDMLTQAGLSVRPIPVACGFHSISVAPARDRFAAVLAQTPLVASRSPVFSNTTATEYPSDPAQMRALLADHMVKPVNFAGEIQQMYDAGARVFVEVGPNNVLTGLVGRILKDQPHVAVASDIPARPGLVQLQHLLGQLAVIGLPVRLDRLFAGRIGDGVAAKSQQLKPTSWLINGGYARPARDPRRVVTPIPAAVTALPKPIEAAPIRLAAQARPTAVAAPAHAVTSAMPLSAMVPAIATGRTQVMLQYQQLMERFLTAQQQVMLTYLKGGVAQPAQIAAPIETTRPITAMPAMALPITAMPTVEMPPPAPAPVAPAPEPLPTPVMTSAAMGLDRNGVVAALTAMIGERTGYPAEMLGLDLNIEADLGIDSIKRVEILGAFRKQHIGETNDAIRAAMEALTRKKTLREVADGLAELIAARQPTPAETVSEVSKALDLPAVVAALTAMIGERTGYPAEMLGLDLNIEADLGIDSIKRVEILGAFRKQHIGETNDAIRAAMEALTRKKTLREVADGLAELVAERAGAAPAVASERPKQGLDKNGITGALTALISERTGYPAEMLGLDLNIEADLGIDSIKRVEILGAFRKQHIGETNDAIRAAMEALTRKKTLREVVDGLAALVAERAAPAVPANGHAPNGHGPNGHAQNGHAANGHTNATNGHRTAEPAAAVDVLADAPRFALVPVSAEPRQASLKPQPDAVYLITDDEGGVAQGLAQRLRALGARPLTLRLGTTTQPLGDDFFAVDLTDLAAVRQLVQSAAGNGHGFGGIFHCLPLKPGKAFAEMTLAEWREHIRRDVKSLFNLAVAVDGIVHTKHPECMVAATRLGGTFGLAGTRNGSFQPTQGGVSGLLKTLDKEWAGIGCRTVDFDGDAAAADIVDRLLVEAAQPKGAVEVGYRGADRFELRPAARPLPTSSQPAIHIDTNSVILVTGGARGITAEVADELAVRYHPTLVLCGSSPLPESGEPAVTAGLSDQRQLKAVLIAEAQKRGETARPAEIEAAYRRLLKEREIRDNIALLRRSAATVEYHQVDVRDEAAFGGFIDDLYARFGRLDGVVHGAGVIEDRLIGDKTSDSFDRVVETKALSSFILARKLHPDSLRFLALFTSVAGRFGNRGQSDYGAANEILSRLALLLDRQWAGRVVAISWGPWDKTGMVSPEVKAQFQQQGIVALSPALGRAAFDAELRLGKKSDAEIVWGQGPWGDTGTVVAAEPSTAPRSDAQRQRIANENASLMAD